MIKNYGTKLTLEQYDLKVTLELPNSDTTISELIELFKGAALGTGYSETMWKRAVCDLAAEYMDDDRDSMANFSEDEIDEAFAQHNAHEEGFDIDFDNTYKAEE